MSGNQKEKITSEEPHMEYPFVARLMYEIIQASGLSHAQLVEILDPYPDRDHPMSAPQIALYLKGTRAMGVSRIFKFAHIAEEHGWITSAVKDALSWEKLNEVEELNSLKADTKKYIKRDKRAEKANLVKLVSVISDLVEMEWSDKDIIALVILLTEKYIPEVNRTGGGTIDDGKLKSIINQSGLEKLRGCKWVSWSMDEKAPLGLTKVV